MHFISLLLYNISIRLYRVGITVASIFNPKAKQWIEGRKLPIPKVSTGAHQKRIWCHCASLGEFEQARPLIEKIKTDKPYTFIILTFFSPSGYEVRKQYKYADIVLYLPLDTAANAKHFVDSIQPDLVLFVKYEFWYHFLRELKTRQIPVILFSAIFRPQQIFFTWYGSLFKDLLKNFSKIFVQNKASKTLLAGIGLDSEICFDTRFDRVEQIAKAAKPFPLVEKFKGTRQLFMAGSTWKKDEQLIAALINSGQFTDFKFVIAPHNLTEQGIEELKKETTLSSVQLTQLNEANAETAQMLIVDTMGDLSALYRYADIAYVGGGFNVSVHNVLEPAVFGVPVIFGPHHSKSAEALELMELGAGFTCSTSTGLMSIMQKMSNSTIKSSAGSQSRNYVKERLGGVEVIYTYISHLL